MIDSHDRIAMLRTPGSPLANAFHLGATVSGWQLSEIAPDRIVIRDAGGNELDQYQRPNRTETLGKFGFKGDVALAIKRADER